MVMNLINSQKRIKIKTQNLMLFALIVLITSCGGVRRELYTAELFKQSQQIYNQREEGGYLEYKYLEGLHRERLKTLGFDIFNIDDGYIYVLDKFGGGYSGNGVRGNIWSDNYNIYYYYLELSSEFKVRSEQKYSDDDWYLFKRAIEEWDLMQISKYYEYINTEGGAYIASRIKIKNNQIIDIENFIWYAN